jgi:hypothetical protein
MTNNQHTQEHTPEDINARLALIRQAVEEKLASRQATSGVSIPEPPAPAIVACPVDPMERLLCDSCQ